MAKIKKINPWWIVLIVAVVLILWFTGSYNGLVSTKEKVDSSWSDVETTYQRRLDLIPNLVNTVEGAVKFEKETQTQIAALRTGITNAKASLSSASTRAEEIAALRQVDSVAGLFNGLNINVERYPELKATENFLSLQDELAGTENRITVARQRYNEAVRAYNVRTKRIPTVFVARMFGFSEEEFFEADSAAAQAPKVEF
jgi:LemA protein